MTKKLLCCFIPILLFMSCSGILWEGESEDIITLSIDNPFYNPSLENDDRALAMQGNYLYMEIALIADQVAYDADTAKAVSGNGTWVETAWGGHAIVSLTLSSLTETIEATFKDVPRDQDLSARAVLETDEATLITGLNGAYSSGTEPICQTYIASGTNPEEMQWVTLTVADLATNAISMPIRPVTPETLFWGGLTISDDYMSAAQTIPTLSETRFFVIEPDLATIMVRDVAYYSLVTGLVDYDGAPPASVSILHNSDGTPFDMTDATYVLSDPYDYKRLQIHSVSLPDYTSPDYILSTSLLLDPMLFSAWNLEFGVLFDQNLSAGDFNSDLEVYWVLPPGFDENDLEFKMIHVDGASILSEDIDSISKIYEYPLVNDFSWNLASWNEGMSRFQYFDSGNSYFPEIDSWFFVLARVPGGEPFIYGKTQIVNLMF